MLCVVVFLGSMVVVKLVRLGCLVGLVFWLVCSIRLVLIRGRLGLGEWMIVKLLGRVKFCVVGSVSGLVLVVLGVLLC